jgi:hypothetical protein
MQLQTRPRPGTRWMATVWLIAAHLSAGSTNAWGEQLVTTLAPADIDSAIQLADDEQALRKFLDMYVIQLRAGWGTGPLIGVFTTPFSRVARAAAAARKNGEAFSASDVTADMAAPEVHVIATEQPLAPGENELASIEAVFVAPQATRDTAGSMKPIKTSDLKSEYQRLYGLTFDKTGVVAVFPLEVVSRPSWIHVTFSRVVRSSAAVSACKECAVPLPTAGIR